MKIIDISRDILNTNIYPGDPEPRVENVHSIADGADCNLNVLHFCLHTGTHADAPLHFIDGAPSIDSIAPDIFIGPCLVIEAPEGGISGDFVDRNFPPTCERLLIKSGGKAWFTPSGAFEASACSLKLIGTDSLSVGISGNQVQPHKAFMFENVAILEGLDLTDVEPGEYFLIALPVKIGGVEAAPVRAILIKDYLFWGAKSE